MATMKFSCLSVLVLLMNLSLSNDMKDCLQFSRSDSKPLASMKLCLEKCYKYLGMDIKVTKETVNELYFNQKGEQKPGAKVGRYQKVYWKKDANGFYTGLGYGENLADKDYLLEQLPAAYETIKKVVDPVEEAKKAKNAEYKEWFSFINKATTQATTDWHNAIHIKMKSGAWEKEWDDKIRLIRKAQKPKVVDNTWAEFLDDVEDECMNIPQMPIPEDEERRSLAHAKNDFIPEINKIDSGIIQAKAFDNEKIGMNGLHQILV